MGGSFDLTILGCSSAIPTSERYPTAQLLNVAERFFLIDCGEGTQIQLRRLKIKFQRISHIFISHLHGDHYLGLVGLLSSMHLLGRKQSLTIYCPPELKEIVELQHRYSQTTLQYEINFRFLRYDVSEVILEDEKVKVETVILNHRIPCCGFIFREKISPRKLISEKIIEYRIPVAELPGIKAGNDFVTIDGKTIKNDEITVTAPDPRSYAYCSDTCYDERIIEKIKKVDLLYHEATFMHQLLKRAKETFHTTALQAATIALKAEVKELLIGHYSARYNDLQPLLDEARTVFENTVLAEEGRKYRV